MSLGVEQSQRIKALERENEHLKDRLKCPICHDIKENDIYRIEACGHRICSDCGLRLKDRCFCCQATIRKKKGWLKKIYY
jgi:hypothetical protein